MSAFKFLIVEDDRPTLSQLQSLIGEEFPDSAVEAARNAAEGRRYLCSVGSASPPYDAVILDFKLPEEQGDNAEVNTSLSREAQRLGHSVLIAQITAFAQDRAVTEHIQKTQIERPNPNTFHVSKRDPDWAEKLVKKLRVFLYTRQVERELDELFGEPAAGLGWGRGRTRFANEIRGGLTHRLGALYRLIETHWNDLEEETIQRIREVLQVDESSDSVRVGLLLKNPAYD